MNVSLHNSLLVKVQDAMVEKIVNELKDFDNIYYEVSNEPYHKGGLREWQNHIIKKIVDTEKPFSKRHLIAQNVQNRTSTVTNPNPNTDIFNWHYAYPENMALTDDISSRNYTLNKPLGNDETGTVTDNNFYRMEGWETIIAGCAVYNNLDLSFLSDDENGSATPGLINGGGPELRGWLKILKDFIFSFDFVEMQPDNSVIVSGTPDGARSRALVEKGRQYAIYIRGGAGTAQLWVELPKGRYQVKWLNTKTGHNDKTENIRHKGGICKLISPAYSEDIALSIKKISYSTY